MDNLLKFFNEEGCSKDLRFFGGGTCKLYQELISIAKKRMEDLIEGMLGDLKPLSPEERRVALESEDVKLIKDMATHYQNQIITLWETNKKVLEDLCDKFKEPKAKLFLISDYDEAIAKIKRNEVRREEFYKHICKEKKEGERDYF